MTLETITKVITFSIIICSYNPDVSIFKRVLTALRNFGGELLLKNEIIIVDNNSSPALAYNTDVKEFLAETPSASLIVETAPGLTNARIAGVSKSKYDWIVFFDDDNEPSSEYLSHAQELINANTHVGIWGPGIVDVKFESDQKYLASGRIKNIFQQKKISGVVIEKDLHNGNNEAFPYGTGMIVQKKILLEYIKNVQNGVFTMSDRVGKSLSSAGDTQILYTAIKMNLYAGSSSGLQVNHLISSAKTGKQKLYKLLYSLNAGQIKAFNEVFPENGYSVTPATNGDCIQLFYQKARGSLKNMASLHDTFLDIAESLGMVKARVVAGNFKTPLFLRLWEKFIGVK